MFGGNILAGRLLALSLGAPAVTLVELPGPTGLSSRAEQGVVGTDGHHPPARALGATGGQGAGLASWGTEAGFARWGFAGDGGDLARRSGDCHCLQVDIERFLAEITLGGRRRWGRGDQVDTSAGQGPAGGAVAVMGVADDFGHGHGVGAEQAR